MTLAPAKFNGKRTAPKVPPRRKGDSDDLKERAALLPSARREFARPRFMPTDPDELDELGSRLMMWAEEPKNMCIDDFFAENRMSAIRYYRGCEANAYLASCLDVALSLIGSRMEKKLSDYPPYLMTAMKHYSSLHREAEQKKLDADTNAKTVKEYEVVEVPVFTAKKEDK